MNDSGDSDAEVALHRAEQALHRIHDKLRDLRAGIEDIQDGEVETMTSALRGLQPPEKPAVVPIVAAALYVLRTWHEPRGIGTNVIAKWEARMNQAICLLRESLPSDSTK